eukprot:COSAG02_NODE_1603_length_11734_cov_5.828105_3_plen_272_part_00
MHCVSTSYEKFEELPGFAMAMAKAHTDRQKCEDVRLSWQQLENLRGKSSFTYSCDAGIRGSSPGTPTGDTDDDECPCSYSRKIASRAPGYEDLWDEDECDLDEGGSCCNMWFSNRDFPGECTFEPNAWFWIVVALVSVATVGGMYVCCKLCSDKCKKIRKRRIAKHEAERKEAERKEAERKEAERKRKEAERKEAEQKLAQQAELEKGQLEQRQEAAKAAQLQFAMEDMEGVPPDGHVKAVEAQVPVAHVTPVEAGAEGVVLASGVEAHNP